MKINPALGRPSSWLRLLAQAYQTVFIIWSVTRKWNMGPSVTAFWEIRSLNLIEKSVWFDWIATSSWPMVNGWFSQPAPNALSCTCVVVHNRMDAAHYGPSVSPLVGGSASVGIHASQRAHYFPVSMLDTLPQSLINKAILFLLLFDLFIDSNIKIKEFCQFPVADQIFNSD